MIQRSLSRHQTESLVPIRAKNKSRESGTKHALAIEDSIRPAIGEKTGPPDRFGN
jgi:hypothetical protein